MGAIGCRIDHAEIFIAFCSLRSIIHSGDAELCRSQARLASIDCAAAPCKPIAGLPLAPSLLRPLQGSREARQNAFELNREIMDECRSDL
jgi:hypothetical protein